MSIKPWKSRPVLVDTLVDRRKLRVIDKKNIERTISRVNYFQLINGLETLLLPNKDVKKFDTETFDDFVAIYKFDKDFTERVFSIIADFELSLKTSVAYNFCKNNCETLNDTMQYTNKNKYEDISKDSDYPFRSHQYENICDDFPKFNLFRTNYLDNLFRKNDFIDDSFYRDPLYEYPPGVAVYSKDQFAAVPMWVAIQTLEFGSLKMMCHYLTKKDINDVLDDFDLLSRDREFFLSMLDIIHELRNKCAHGSLINRFRTSNSIIINNKVVNALALEPYNKSPASVLKLFDSLKVLGYFEDLTSLRRPLKAIIYRNNRFFKRRTYDLNDRLLSRMGEDSYKKWKIMIKNSKKD